MKKTIIMLLAMSSIASAALEKVADMKDLLVGATLGTGVTNISDEYTNSTVLSFANTNSAVLSIENSELASYINAKEGYLTIAAWVNPTSVGEHSIFGWGANGDVGVKVAIKDGHAQETTKGKTDHTMDYTTISANGEWQFVAFSIALNGSATSRILLGDDAGTYYSNRDWGTWNGEASTFSIGSAWSESAKDQFKGDIANLTIYYSSTTAATQQDLKDAGILVKPIPEPATATLSLLALAGLAARRRRH